MREAGPMPESGTVESEAKKMTRSKSRGPKGLGSMSRRSPTSIHVEGQDVDPLANMNTYELHNLVHHLAAGERDQDLRHLLRLELTEPEDPPQVRRGLIGLVNRRREGVVVSRRHRNAWQNTKEAHGLTHEYAEEIALAFAEARAAGDREVATSDRTHVTSLGLEVRYALMATSLNELAARVPPQLAAALVKAGVWSQEQGALYARRIPEVEKRLRVLISLSAVLEGELGDHVGSEALEAVAQLSNDTTTSYWMAMCDLIPSLSLENVRRAEDVVAPHADMARHTAAALGGRLAQWGCVGEAIEFAERQDDKDVQIETWTAIAAFLDVESLRRITAMTQTTGPDRNAELRGALHARELALGMADEALSGLDALEEGHPWALPEALMRAVEQAASADLAPLRQRINALPEPKQRVPLLLAMARRVDPAQRALLVNQILNQLPDIRDQALRGRLLADLVPHVPETALPAAGELARGSPRAEFAWADRLAEPARSRAFRDVVEHIPADRRVRLLIPAGWARFQPTEALAAVRAGGGSIGALDETSEDLPPEFLSSALAANLERYPHPETGGGRQPALVGALLLAELAAFERPETALAQIRALPVLEDRGEALIAAATRVPDGAVPEIMDSGMRMPNPTRTRLIAELAPRLPSGQRLAAVEACRPDSQTWVDAIQVCAQHLSERELHDALKATRFLRKDNRRTILTSIAPFAPPSLLDDALDLAHRLDRTEQGGRRSGRRHFEQELFSTVPLGRRLAALSLAPQLAASGRCQEAMAILEDVTRATGSVSDVDLERAFVSAAPHLRGATLDRALKLAKGDHMRPVRAALLASLPPSRRTEVARKMQRAVTVKRFVFARDRILERLAPSLPPDDRVLKAIAREDGHGLTAQIAYLPPALLGRALAIARTSSAHVSFPSFAEIALRLPEQRVSRPPRLSPGAETRRSVQGARRAPGTQVRSSTFWRPQRHTPSFRLICRSASLTHGWSCSRPWLGLRPNWHGWEARRLYSRPCAQFKTPFVGGDSLRDPQQPEINPCSVRHGHQVQTSATASAISVAAPWSPKTRHGRSARR